MDLLFVNYSCGKPDEDGGTNGFSDLNIGDGHVGLHCCRQPCGEAGIDKFGKAPAIGWPEQGLR